jgi:signal transduction histidine kinase
VTAGSANACTTRYEPETLRPVPGYGCWHGPMPEDILVVDDQRANLIALEAALGYLPGSLVFAASGEEALRVLLERDFAVILLDVRMPGLGGLETARLIRGRQRSRHTPIIFVTAHGYDETEVRDAYALGAVDFLTKPLVLEILRAKVNVFVELHRRNEQVAAQKVRLREMEHAERIAAALSEADRQKDEFLALLGHELRNPLVPLTAGLELLHRRLLPPSSEDDVVIRTRLAMERQLKQLTRLVDDLLDVSRITSGKLELRKSAVDLREVLEQAVATTRPQLVERKQLLHVSLPPEPLPAVADPARLTQVFVNLLRNAIQYSDDGGEIHFVCRHQGDQVEVRVADNGRGIKADFLPRLFDKFVQEGGGGGGGGMGLGLMLVKRLTEMHGGQVDVKSDGVGKGSEFIVRLPLASSPEAMKSSSAGRAATGGAAGKADPTSRPRLALVDDNPDIRETMSELLTLCGYDVQMAEDGAAGVELITQMRPSAALVDIGLPKLNGYEVAVKVRAIDGLSGMRLVAMSGFGQESDRRRALEAGFDVHIVKPAELDVLLRALAPDSGS